MTNREEGLPPPPPPPMPGKKQQSKPPRAPPIAGSSPLVKWRPVPECVLPTPLVRTSPIFKGRSKRFPQAGPSVSAPEESENDLYDAAHEDRSVTSEEALDIDFPDDITVLKEHAFYVPSKEEVYEYAKWLGMKFDEGSSDKDHVWIAWKAMRCPLPAPWIACKILPDEDRVGGTGSLLSPPAEEGEVFYFNPKSGQALRHHPLDEHWLTLYQQVRGPRK